MQLPIRLRPIRSAALSVALGVASLAAAIVSDLGSGMRAALVVVGVVLVVRAIVVIRQTIDLTDSDLAIQTVRGAESIQRTTIERLRRSSWLSRYSRRGGLDRFLQAVVPSRRIDIDLGSEVKTISGPLANARTWQLLQRWTIAARRERTFAAYDGGEEIGFGALRLVKATGLQVADHVSADIPLASLRDYNLGSRSLFMKQSGNRRRFVIPRAHLWNGDVLVELLDRINTGRPEAPPHGSGIRSETPAAPGARSVDS